MDQNALILFAIYVTLIVFSPAIASGAWWAYTKVRDRIPAMPSAKGVVGGLLSAKLDLEYWKVLLIFAGGWVLMGGATWQGCSPSISTDWHLPTFTTKPDAVTYVFEKDDTGAVPSEVASGLAKLNAKGILATSFEQDTIDGTGETPEQYKVSLAAAKSAGLPSLISTAGKRVLKVIKAPKTEAEVLGVAL